MKRTTCLLLAAVLSLGICGCQSVKPHDAEDSEFADAGTLPTPEPPRLKSGETVQISIDGIPEAEEDVFADDIAADGTITLAYLGKVKIMGMTAAEAGDHLQQLYIDKQIYKSPVVRVFPASQFIYVSGRIARPGRYPWSTDLTVARMIEVAGDFNEFASHKVRLQRGDAQPVSVNVDAIRQGKTADVPLYPGDRIIIPRSW